MAIYAVKTDRMDITWDLSSGYIFVQQKWRYNWINESGVTPWTLEEKRDFHNRADKLIWDLWSSQAYAMITSNSKLAKHYRNTKFKINVDIKWVIGKESEHWTVNVTKRNHGTNINWIAREIQLYSSVSINSYGRQGVVDPTMRYAQVGVTHEFGHTLGNSEYALDSSQPAYPMHGDEYKGRGLSKYKDDASIMSVGSNIRQRHFDYLKIQLENLINNKVEIYLF